MQRQTATRAALVSNSSVSLRLHFARCQSNKQTTHITVYSHWSMSKEYTYWVWGAACDVRRSQSWWWWWWWRDYWNYRRQSVHVDVFIHWAVCQSPAVAACFWQRALSRAHLLGIKKTLITTKIRRFLSEVWCTLITSKDFSVFLCRSWRWTSWSSRSLWTTTRPCLCGTSSRPTLRLRSMWVHLGSGLCKGSGLCESLNAVPYSVFIQSSFHQTLCDSVWVCVVLQDGLFRVFSSFGPLYLLKVCHNAPLSLPGFYALIKFYSAAQASKAQRQTDGHSLFQSSPLKVITAHAPTHSAVLLLLIL